MHSRVIQIVAFVFAYAIATAAHAQAWRPDKPVELITSSAAGGSNDQIARVMQRIWQDGKLLPVPVSVVNKSGGNQTIAPTYLNMKPGDAHFLLLANPTLSGNHIAGITPIGPNEVVPVAHLLTEHTVFSVRSDAPIKSARDLFERLKADPAAFSIGIVAVGGPNHLALAQAAKIAGVDPRKLKTVVFKTNADSMTALAGNHIQLVASSINSARAQVKAGNARILGVASPRRMSGDFASVPTLREQGIDATVSSWRGIFAPKGATPAQVAYWEDALAKLTASAEWKAALDAQGWDGEFMRAAEFGKYVQNDYNAVKALMTELGLGKQ